MMTTFLKSREAILAVAIFALLAVIADPYQERAGLEAYALPAPEAFVAGFRTFCGT